MKETLITFDTSILARSKGFQERVFFYWCHQNQYEPFIQNYIPDEDEDHYGGSNINDLPQDMMERVYSAPTQSLLQKWLREKHKISIKVDDFTTEGKTRFDHNISSLGSQEDNTEGLFASYEEALEQGLQEALKLIPQSNED